MFPKNTWYVVCTPNEIAGKSLSREICNERIVFYRNEKGKVIALEDYCPHRGAPLSLGAIEDGKIVCGYHGMKMNDDGSVHSMPKQQVKKFPCVKSFAVEERYGFIWLWPGDADKAESSLIPELEWAQNAEWAYGGGLYHINCDYRLMIDNLMDLTHETYVHSTSIGQKEIDEAPVNTETKGDTVITSRFMNNITAPPFWRMAMQSNGMDPKMPVDRWQICRFSPPSHVMIDVGVAPTGKGGHEAKDEDKTNSVVVDFITPESENSMWYFWGMARRFKPQDNALTDTIREGQGKIFAEDLDMLEQQQKNIEQFYPGRRLMKLDIDSGGVWSRMAIDRMIKNEQVAEG